MKASKSGEIALQTSARAPLQLRIVVCEVSLQWYSVSHIHLLLLFEARLLADFGLVVCG